MQMIKVLDAPTAEQKNPEKYQIIDIKSIT